jgi:hypothetical protein
MNNTVPILGQKKVQDPKCPGCSAQPMVFATKFLANPATGQQFMVAYCSECSRTISIQIMPTKIELVQAPMNPTLKM